MGSASLGSAACVVLLTPPCPHPRLMASTWFASVQENIHGGARCSLAVVPPVNKRSAQETVRSISRRKHLGLNDVYIFIRGQLTFPM